MCLRQGFAIVKVAKYLLEHPSMKYEHTSSEKETYSIRIRGHLDLKWQDWFDGITIKYPNKGETLLIGTVKDQSALQGMLATIHNLGLCLLSVNRIESIKNNHQNKT
jgi:hypothetical protein